MQQACQKPISVERSFVSADFHCFCDTRPEGTRQLNAHRRFKVFEILSGRTQWRLKEDFSVCIGPACCWRSIICWIAIA
jgi:hypothetical protein